MASETKPIEQRAGDRFGLGLSKIGLVGLDQVGGRRLEAVSRGRQRLVLGRGSGTGELEGRLFGSGTNLVNPSVDTGLVRPRLLGHGFSLRGDRRPVPSKQS